MRNIHPGICYRCNKIVGAKQGHIERVVFDNAIRSQIKNKWRVQHAECAIKYRGTKKGKQLERIDNEYM